MTNNLGQEEEGKKKGGPRKIGALLEKP